MPNTPTLLKITFGAKTDKGLVRDLNEDHLITREISGRHDLRGIFAVADGMGGHNAGEVASQYVIDTFGDYLAHSAPGFASNGYKYVLEEVISLANRKIFSEANSDNAKKGMGTTFTGVLLENNNLHLGHVGDSRAYVIRHGRIQQITEEHTYVADLLKKNKITKAEAKSHVDSNVITRAVGLKDSVKIDVKSLPLHDGDIVVLTTDGLTDLVTDSEIQQIVTSRSDPQQAAEEMVRTGNQRGGDDNLTAIVLFVGRKRTPGSQNKLMTRTLFACGLLLILSSLGLLSYTFIKDRLSMIGVPANMGKISVSSPKPGAVAYVNGIWVGKTPVNEVLFDVGTHKLEVKCSGFTTYVKKIAIASRGKTSVQAKFYGALHIISDPRGLQVEINGRRLSQATPVIVELEVGRPYNIVVSGQGVDPRAIRKEFFADSAREQLILSFKQFGDIEVESYLLGDQQLFLDDSAKPIKFNDHKTVLSRVTAGKHLIKIVGLGEKYEQNIVEVFRGRSSKSVFSFGLKQPMVKQQDKPVVATANKPPAERVPTPPMAREPEKQEMKGTLLLVKVDKPDFYYSITGQGIDILPKPVKGMVLRQTGFAPGKYYLTISKEGYEDSEKELELVEGKVASLNIELIER
ncbi:MAG: Stp1/IreP family PP2C-type Ser/Thr phosphatase [Candidatus Margulisiibacteriota bacterium]|jgi:protein phosphatase